MTAGVVTGEAVVLDVRLAHWPSRLLAKLIDLTAQFMLLVILLLVIGRLFDNADTDTAAAISICIIVFVFVGYNVILETIWRGRTLGKAALGIRVVRDDGGPARFRHALVRGIMFPLEGWGPALIASIISKRGKRLGDLLAGTIVVSERVPGQTVMPALMPPQLMWWAATLELSRFGDDLAMACRQFLARQNELNPAARDAMGGQLVAAVSAVVAPPPPAGTPGWAYLSAVLAERRRREEQRMYAGQQPGYGSGYAPQPGYAAQPGFGPLPPSSAPAPAHAPAPSTPAPSTPAPSTPAPPAQPAQPTQPAQPQPPGPFAPPQ
jgi:uncharacterized RDD family membrane protein YckC